ncbi:MAG: hypothetical protein GY757_10075 [bacterium]|nr:hypothetical protein [bacterium]
MNNSVTVKEASNFCEKVEKNLKPEGRATATAKTLEQLFFKVDCSLGDLGAAWAALAEGKVTDDPPTTARRKTCAELAALVDGDGDAAKAVNTWTAWINHFGLSDPRHMSMNKTFTRELNELRELK